METRQLSFRCEWQACRFPLYCVCLQVRVIIVKVLITEALHHKDTSITGTSNTVNSTERITIHVTILNSHFAYFVTCPLAMILKHLLNTRLSIVVNGVHITDFNSGTVGSITTGTVNTHNVSVPRYRPFPEPSLINKRVPVSRVRVSHIQFLLHFNEFRGYDVGGGTEERNIKLLRNLLLVVIELLTHADIPRRTRLITGLFHLVPMFIIVFNITFFVYTRFFYDFNFTGFFVFLVPLKELIVTWVLIPLHFNEFETVPILSSFKSSPTACLII